MEREMLLIRNLFHFQAWIGKDALFVCAVNGKKRSSNTFIARFTPKMVYYYRKQ